MMTILVGPILLLATFAGGLVFLELLVRAIKPQITFSQGTGLTPTYFADNPYAAFSLKPNFRLGDLMINSLGYRGTEFSKDKPKGTFRILLLGDSYVFGWGVNRYEDTLSAIIQNILNSSSSAKYEVINAGFHDGYSPDSYYAYLKGEGLALQPDMIIEGIYLQNDIADLKGHRWENIDELGLPQRVVSAGWRIIDEQGRLVDAVLPLRYKFPYLRESHLWILITNWLDLHFPVLYSDKEAKMVKEFNTYYWDSRSDCIFEEECSKKFLVEYGGMIKAMKGTVSLLKSHGVPLLFVFEPSALMVGADQNFSPTVPLPSDRIFALQQKVMNDISQSYPDTQFLDLTPDFLIPDTADYYNHPDVHWNARGDTLAATVIAKRVQDMLGQ